MIAVRALSYRPGRLVVEIDDDAGTRLEFTGHLGIAPQQPTKDEFLRWDLLLGARPSDDHGRGWATLTVQPPASLWPDGVFGGER